MAMVACMYFDELTTFLQTIGLGKAKADTIGQMGVRFPTPRCGEF
jgi:hypothetical protein